MFMGAKYLCRAFPPRLYSSCCTRRERVSTRYPPTVALWWRPGGPAARDRFGDMTPHVAAQCGNRIVAPRVRRGKQVWAAASGPFWPMPRCRGEGARQYALLPQPGDEIVVAGSIITAC